MTNKIASEVLKASSIQQMSFCKVIVDGKSFSVKEALDIAIKVLEQEPCDDTISRQEALNVVHKYFEHYLQLNDDICLDGLRSLPSVTPKEKIGHWIDDEFGSKCSCCNIHTHLDKFDRPMKFKYCSMCGAKMEVNEMEQNNLIQGKRAKIFEFVLDEDIKAHDAQTNGSIFLKTYPDSHLSNVAYDDGICYVYVDLGGSRTRFTSDWWNASYKAGDTDGKDRKVD